MQSQEKIIRSPLPSTGLPSENRVRVGTRAVHEFWRRPPYMYLCTLVLPSLCQLNLPFIFITPYVSAPKTLLLLSCPTDMEIAAVPKPGEWPIDPQTDVKISEHRIWVDGCFDFAHHGVHARDPQSWRIQRAYWN